MNRSWLRYRNLGAPFKQREKKHMNKKNNHDERIAKMIFASVYPHYVTKVEKKGRSKEELNQVIEWLTGYNEQQIKVHINDKVTFESFFRNASLNPNAALIKGV